MTELTSSVRNLKKQTEPRIKLLSGNLGITLGGQQVVDVPTRLGWVYVRLLNNTSELIQAYNGIVSPIYNLPVLVKRNQDRYEITGRDTLRYQNWGTEPYLPKHGITHSFDPAHGGGSDLVWVHQEQFYPLAPMPSGTYGGPNLLVAPYIYNWYGNWKYAGGVTTPDVVSNHPTGSSSSKLMLLCLNGDTEAFHYIEGDEAPYNSTGITDLLSYLPYYNPSTDIPIAAIRIFSGTSSIGWDEIYDVRQFYNRETMTGSFSGGGVDNFLDLTDTPNSYVGQGGRYVRVKADVSGLEFATGTSGGIGGDITEWISVKEYGAVGDGSNDDTTAISNAISAIPVTGGVLYFPPGIYKTSGGFILNHSIQVLGCGHGGYVNGETVITCTSATASLFTVNYDGCIFLNIDLQNTAVSSPSAGAGITVTQGNFCQYKGISVYGFFINIDIQVGGEWAMDDYFSFGPVKYGLKIRNTASPDWGDSKLSNITFMPDAYNPDAAIRIESGGGIKITNLKINDLNGTNKFVHGIDLAVASSVITGQLLISNSSIENVSGNGINASTSSSSWYSIILDAMEFGLWGNTTGNPIHFVAGSAAELDAIVISNNVFMTNSSAQSAIYLEKIDNAQIKGNVISGFADLLTQIDCTNIILDGVIATPGVSGGALIDPTTDPGDMIYRTVSPINLATVALGASATANTTNNGYVAGNVLDTDVGTYWSATGVVVVGDWIKINLGASKSFASFHIYQHGSDTAYEASIFTVETSPDDINWTSQGSYSINTGNDNYNLPASVTAQYVRFTATAGGGYAWLLRQIEIFDGALGGIIRLPIGSEDQVLTVISGLPTWEDFSGTGTIGSGDVVGPTGSIDGHVALFDGITGKLIKDGGSPAGGGDVYGDAGGIDNHLAIFDGDGYHLKDGGVTPGAKINLITNGDFPSDNSGWTATSPATITQSSDQGIVSRVNSGFNDHMVYQDVTVVNGQLYLIGTDYIARSGAGVMYFYVIDNGVTRTLVTGPIPPACYSFIHQAASTTLRIAFSVAGDATGTITIDNVFVISL